MRVAYGIALLAIVAFLLAVAIPADVTWPMHIALVVACIVLATLCLWVTVGPRMRRPLVLRIAGLVVGSVTGYLALAGSGAFDPPRREFAPASETRSLSDTGSVLQSAGYGDASVTYPRNAPETILVRYGGAPSLDQPGVADDMAAIVWAHEGVRFRTLVIRANGTSATISYDELATRLGPRPSGLDSLDIAQVQELARLGPALFEAFDDVGREATHGGAFLGAGLLALIGLVATSWTAVRRMRASLLLTPG